MKLNKYTNKDDTHFINIDKRKRDDSGNVVLMLDSGQEVIMPSTVTKVPALLLLNENYRVMFGNDIVSFLNIEAYSTTKIDTKKEVFENPQSEPTTFEWMSASGVSSDSFSFLDTDPEDLNAKGSGGQRQMYNYAHTESMSSIQTPDENYKSDTIGNDENGTLENLQSNRENDIKGIYSKQNRV